MNITIMGNGKMWQAISKIAKEKGYTIIQRASSIKPVNTLD